MRKIIVQNDPISAHSERPVRPSYDHALRDVGLSGADPLTGSEERYAESGRTGTDVMPVVVGPRVNFT